MDYKTISTMLGERGAGLTDYDELVSNRRAKTQAELAGLDEMQDLIDYTTPPQLRAAKMDDITGRRDAIAAERQQLETDEDFLRRYATSREQGAYSPAPTASREMESYIAPTAHDMIQQPVLSDQTFEEQPIQDTSSFELGPFDPTMGMGRAVLGSASELVRGVPRGGANMVASVPSITGAMQASSNREAVAYLDQSETLLRRMAEQKQAGMDQFEFIQQSSDMLDGAPQAIKYKISQALGNINAGDDPETVITKFREDMLNLPLETKDTGGFKLAEAMHAKINETIPVQPGYEDSWSRKIGEGGGSLLPIIAGGIVGGPAGAIAMGMGGGGGSAVEEAVRDKAGEDDILKYGLAGTAIGITEAAPVGKLLGTGVGMVGRSLGVLEKVAPATMAKVTSMVAKMTPAAQSKFTKAASSILGQAIEEGAQEATAQTLLNVAGQLTYDEDRPLSEGVGEAALLGGIIGGGVRGIQLGGRALMEKERPEIETTLPPGRQDPATTGTDDGPDLGPTGLGGREGDILRGEVDYAEPVSGILDGLTIDGERLTGELSRTKEPSTGIGGLEGEIMDKDRAPVVAEPIRGTLERPIVEGEVNRPALDGKRQLPGSTEDYEVIDDGLDEFADYVRKTKPSAPLRIERQEDLVEAAGDVKEPTEAQKEAGNYRKGHMKVDGLDITIETPKGAERKGVDPNGKEWSVEMPGHYGYIKRSTGMDGDHVDVTVGDEVGSGKVFVVDQINADTKQPDEHKVIMGVSSPEAAADLYRKQFSDGRGEERMGAMVELDTDGFKGWLKNGDTKKPIAQQMPDAVIQTTETKPAPAEAAQQRENSTSPALSDVQIAETAPAASLSREEDVVEDPEYLRLERSMLPDGVSIVRPDPTNPTKWAMRFNGKTIHELTTPKLANRHIDAMREYARSSSTASVEKTGDGTYIVKTADGRGHLGLADRGKFLKVGIASVSKERQGKGSGLSLYEEALRFAGEQGKTLRSDMAVSEKAVRVYDALKRRGYTVTQNPDIDILKTKDGGMVGPSGSWVFEVKPKENVSAKPETKPGVRQPGSASEVANPQRPATGQAPGSVPEAARGAGKRPVQNASERAEDARGRNRGRNTVRLRGFAEKSDGQTERVKLVHYGDKFHNTIKPQDGWRTRGAEKARAGDPDFVPRSYFGIGVGKEGGYQKDVAGGFGHSVAIDPDELYDAKADPDGLNAGKGVSAYEKAIKEAGYSGFITSIGLKGNQGIAAVMFYDTDVEEHHDAGIKDDPTAKRAKGLERTAKLGASNKRLFVGPVKRAREVKAKYAKEHKIRPATTIREYVKVDEERAKKIAQAFEEMKHEPQDPIVKRAYEAMIRETLDQYQTMVDNGFKAEMIKPGMKDPYEESPRLAIEDIRDNNHMWVFPTVSGFGSSDLDVSDNPLLAETEFKDINGVPMLANDIFRAVHDYFGHAVEGNGMRARGEEMAWRVHASMYSPLARRAMTTETRGQNSWVNYGPHGEANKTASGADTVYAPQKIGLLPEFASSEGLHDGTHLKNIEKARKMHAGRGPATVRRKTEKKPDSLIEFIAKNGGIKPDGELKAIGLTDPKTGFVSGAGPMVRPTGKNADRVREMVEQAGYLREGSTLRDLYDALDKDARSGREVFSRQDDAQAERWRNAPESDTYDLTETFKLAPDNQEQLKRWFGKSKMIDEDGDPAVYHHTTHNDFEVFDRKWADGRYKGSNGKPIRDSIDQIGIWFTDEADVNRYGPKRVSAYLKIEKPFYIDDGSWDDNKEGQPRYGKDDVYTRLNNLVKEYGGADGLRKALKEDGHDGIILQGWLDGYRGNIAIAFEPNQVKSTSNTTFDESNPIHLYKLAPGFYSALTKGIETAKQKQAQPKDWKAIIAALPGVRKAEIDWIDVNGWLDGQTGQVTRDDLVAFVKANEIEINEVILTKNGMDDGRSRGDDSRFSIEISDTDPMDPDDDYLDSLAEDRMDEVRDEMREELDEDEEIDEDEVRSRAKRYVEQEYNQDPEYSGAVIIDFGDGSRFADSYYYRDGEYTFDGEIYSSSREMRNAVEEMAAELANEKGLVEGETDYGTQYDSYTEQGGNNYREILLTIPGLEDKGTNATHRIDPRVHPVDKEAYESSHFDKTENIIVHARTTDRRGGEVLFIEEVQSDLGSDLRKGGLPPTEADFERWKQLNDAIEAAHQTQLDAEIALQDKFEEHFADEIKAVKADTKAKNSAMKGEKYLPLELFLRDVNKGLGHFWADTLGAKESISDEDLLYVQIPYQSNIDDKDLKEIYPYARWLHENATAELKAVIDTARARDDAKLRVAEMKDPNEYRPSALPNFPFEGESYYHLAMKRMLRLAVDEGKKAIAWTPAYMQGRRWSNAVQNVVRSVHWGETYDTGREVELRGVNGIDIITVDQNGVMRSAKGGKIRTKDIEGKKLSELIGKPVADQVMGSREGVVRDQQIVVGGEGYTIAYDRLMKNFMEKFAKKYGSAVTLDKTIMSTARYNDIRVMVKNDESLKANKIFQLLQNSGHVDKTYFAEEHEKLMTERVLVAAERNLADVKEKIERMERTIEQEPNVDGSPNDYYAGLLKSLKEDLVYNEDVLRQIKEKTGEKYEFNHKAVSMRIAEAAMTEQQIIAAIGDYAPMTGDPVWKVEINDKMRDAILEGQPFSIGRQDYQITPEAQNKIDDLLATIKKVAPGLKVRMEMSIDDNKNIWGKYSRDNGAITIAAIALDAGRGKQVFGHEALHAFVDHGLLSRQEIEILQRYSEKHDLIGKYGLREAYEKTYGARGLDPADYQRMLNEEGLAELVGEMIGTPDTKIPGDIAGIIGRLKRLLERLANAIRGLGFQSSTDILKKISSGEVGRRQMGDFTPSDGALYSLGQDRVTSIKRTVANDLGDFLATDSTVVKRGRALQRYLQDKFLSVKLMQRALADQIADDENAYLSEELSAARIPEQTQQMNDKMQDVLEDLHDAGVDPDLFERFLRMRHAKERNENIAKINTKFKDGGSGTKTAVAERWLKNAARLIPAAKMQAMKDAAAKVYAINRESLKIRLDGGLIDQDYYNELTGQYRYYVPLKGHEFLDDLKPMSNNRGLGAKGSGLKQAMGRRSEAQNTLSYVVEDFRRAIYSAERNKVNISLFNFIKNNTKKKADGTDAKADFFELDPIRYKRILVKKRGLYQGRKIWVPADFVGDNAKIDAYLKGLEGNASERLRLDPTPAHNDLPVMIGGKRHIMRVKNDTLLNDLLDMHTNVERIPFFSAAMGGFTRMLTMWNPAFAPTNFARDVMGVGLTAGSELGAKEAAKIMKSAFKMTTIILKSVSGKTSTDPETLRLLDLYKEMKLAGGSTGFSHVVRDAETIQRELEQEAEWMSGNRSTVSRMKHGIVVADRFMEKFNRIFEDATRLAAYQNRLDAGDTQKQALSYAKNITVNFNKRGHQAGFSQWYAFANANFQGNYRMLRALINGKNGGKVLGGLVMGGFLYGLANILMGYDDEDPEKLNSWYERNQYDKAFYIILGPIKLPKPHGFMIPFDIGTKMAELMMAAIDPEHCNPARRSNADLTASAVAEIGASLTSFVPIGTQEDTVLRFFPTLLAPVGSAALNMSPFGGAIYPDGFDRTKPNWKQFYAETPEIYHSTAKWMNTLSGGNDFESGYVDVSPEVLEFIVNSYLGGAGGELRKASGLAMAGIDAALGNEVKPIRIEDIPIIRRFFPSQRTNSLTDYYFQFNDRMQTVKSAISEAKDGSEQARTFLKEHEVERQLMGQWEAAKKQRTAVRKKIDALDEDRRDGGHIGMRRDILINKRALIERRFARTFQIADQIADLKDKEQTPAVRAAIEKLNRDKAVMSANIAKLIADQDNLLASRPSDTGRIATVGSMFR